jgi:hypothetical protein
MQSRRAGLGRFVLSLHLFCVSALPAVGPAPQSSPALTGMWTASAGAGQMLRGTWSAEISPGSRNRAQGSWTLLSDGGEILMQGTWSARKADREWQGSWTARTSNGGSFSGTWSAYLPDFTGKSLGEMLERTAVKQVAGSWQSGRHQGNWWLDGAGPKPGRK